MKKQLVKLGDGMSMDLGKLVVSRLLVQANSGGGKSRMLRRLLEQTHGKIQQIVIDVEGEFTTLRKKFDYVVASKNGDTPVDPRGAAMLAERLLELKVSAICDLYELRPADRIRFVKLFCDAMVNAPKHLWHPVLVVVDEAHVFCPQIDEAESSDSIKDLATRGRKRGFCLVLATQRLSKLHKDAAAEMNNKLIGRSSMDIDMKRAGAELGFAERSDLLSLRRLKPGEFYAFGPALTDEVTLFRGGDVITAHPKAGSHALTAPAPSSRVRKLLPRLADLPAEVDERELTKQETRRQIADLKAKNAQLEKDVKAHQPKQISVFGEKERRRLQRQVTKLNALNWRRIEPALNGLTRVLGQLLTGINAVPMGGLTGANRTTVQPYVPTGPVDPDALREATFSQRSAEWRILAAAVQSPGASPEKVSATARIPMTKSTFRLAVMRLIRGKLLDDSQKDGRKRLSAFRPTPTGFAVIGDHVTPPSTNTAEHWRKELGGTLSRRIFDVLWAEPSKTYQNGDIGQILNVDVSKSTYRLAVLKLRRLELAITSGNTIRLNPEHAHG